MEISTKAVLDTLFYSEVLAAVFASIFYFKYKNTPARYLLIILWMVALTEFIGGVMAEKKVWLYKDTYSYWLYNIMFPVWKFLYLWIYYKTLENILYKKWVERFLIILCVAVAINWIFLQDFLNEIESYSYILGSSFIAISSIFYLLELLRSEKIIVFHRKLLFWVSVGLLIFYSGTIPFILVRDFYSSLDHIHNVFLILYILGIIMYLTFSFGFIWSKKE